MSDKAAAATLDHSAAAAGRSRPAHMRTAAYIVLFWVETRPICGGFVLPVRNKCCYTLQLLGAALCGGPGLSPGLIFNERTHHDES
jgi:hypothetical protein